MADRGSRSAASPRFKRHGAIINFEAFEHDGRRLRIGRDGRRINHRHAAHRRKPELAVARLDARRPAPAVAFDVLHPVALAKGDRRDRADFPLGKIVQFLFAHAIDAAIAAHPDPAEVVFQDLKHAVVKEPVLRRVAREPAILEAPQPAVIRANPQRAIAVLSERPHRIARQAVRFGPGGEASIPEMRQAAVAAQPEAACAISNNDFGVITSQSVFGREVGSHAIFVAHHAALSAEPERSLLVFVHCPAIAHFRRQNFLRGAARQTPVNESLPPVGPDTPGAILKQRSGSKARSEGRAGSWLNTPF